MQPGRLLLPHRSSPEQRGFTLIELLTVIAIIAIFVAFAVPAMGDFIRNSRVRSEGQELRAALVRGRSEAINRNTEVRVVPIDSRWRNGWRVETTGGLEIEAASEPLGSQVTAPIVASPVVFRIDGRLRSGAQTVVLSDPSNSHIQSRCISMKASGVASTRVDTDFDSSNGCN